MGQLIEHNGIIKKIQTKQLQVLILQNSACSDCHAKSACSVSDKTEKIIDVDYFNSDFKIGDKVTLFGSQSIGFNAVTFAFIIPFVLILTTLLVLKLLILNEVYAGLLSVSILIPYYLILSLFKNKLKSKFKFEIRKLINDL